MMTPSELKQYEFKTAGRNAYKADDVDSFFGEVLVNYEKMFRENSELVKRVSLLADRLETYKKDEVDIKQAVLSAQKAADIIVRDAEESVADAKQEAQAVLAAAKGEAEIIKSDAERQAVADSDLLLSIARDKAEEIMNKAKEKAHGILIAANDSASDTVGAATRTITSESIHYDMLKKEVSEFRASILAQYKAHIELISKLPELAVEEAAKIESTPSDNPEISDEVAVEPEQSEPESFDTATFEEENSVLEFVDDSDNSAGESEEETVAESEAEITQADFDFEEGDTVLSYESEEASSSTNDAAESEPADIPISRRFSVSSTDFDFDGFDDSEVPDTAEDVTTDDTVDDVPETDDDAAEYDDDDDDSVSSFFDSIESIDTENDEDEPKKRKGLFGKWK